MRKKKYDAIVIGSGLGGLVSAYILAQNGYSVVVFEKNSQLGGCMQTFRRGGAKFETGLHCIGSMREGESLHRIFKYLHLDNIPISPLNKNGFNIVSLGDEEYPIPQLDQFVKTLSKRFPRENAGLKAYLREIRRISKSLPYFSVENLENPQLLNPMFTMMDIDDFIGSYIKDRTLRKVLCGNAPFYAGQKEKTPAYIHALFNDYYIKSAYRICGSNEKIVRSLSNSIREAGGEIYTSSKIERINCENGKATTVQLPSGETIEADYIISDTHPDILLRLTNKSAFSESYRNKLKEMEHTPSIFTIYIQFKKNTVPYRNYNFIKYQDDEVWGYEQYTEDEWPRNYIYMHNCPEDPSEYAESAEINTFMNYEDVAQWENYEAEQRGIRYEIFKHEKAQKLLELWGKRFPEDKENIETFYTATPLTYRDYTGSRHGSVFGIAHDINALDETTLSHRTEIQNLYLAGQNANLHGALGVIISAINACSEIIGKHKLIKQILDC